MPYGQMKMFGCWIWICILWPPNGERRGRGPPTSRLMVEDNLVARILRPRPHMDTGYLFDDPVSHVVTLSASRLVMSPPCTYTSMALCSVTGWPASLRPCR